MDDLIEKLQGGCVYRPKRWSGDTHDDLGGPIDEAATESLLAEAAAALSQQRAVEEGWVLVPEKLTPEMAYAASKAARHSELDGYRLLAIYRAMLAAAPSPEQEE